MIQLITPDRYGAFLDELTEMHRLRYRIFKERLGWDVAFQRWWGKNERLAASPAAAAVLMLMNSQIDISDIVSTIRVPTLVIRRTEDKAVNVELGRFLAEHIPGARYIELPGVDHVPFVGDNADDIADAIEEFLAGSRAVVAIDRVLATVLFTDIVCSTEKAGRAR
jgi:pimeloyl-ACP methyl ester carboxylesterase